MQKGRLIFIWRFLISLAIGFFLYGVVYLGAQFKEAPNINAMAILWCCIIFLTFESVTYVFRRLNSDSQSGSSWSSVKALAAATGAGVLTYMHLFYGFRWLDHLWYHSVAPTLSEQPFSIMISFGASAFFALVQFLFTSRNRYLAAELQNERYKNELNEANLTLLKNQLDPHFLFNNFNTLYYLIEEDSALAREFLRNLSDIYRQLLHGSDNPLIAASEEYKLSRQYLAVMKQRYQEGLIVEDRVEASHLSGQQLPPLVLQQLIENAAKHNRIETSAPLTITLLSTTAALEIRNTVRPKKTETSHGTGLKNIRQRYQYLSKDSVEVISNDDSFTVIIPLIAHEH